MKRSIFLSVALALSGFVYAQNTVSAPAEAVSSSIQVSNEQLTAPGSNIDILKKSLGQAKQAPRAVGTTAVRAQSTAGSSAKAPAKTSADATLEMPLDMGGNAPAAVVKTQVQPTKKLSAKTANRVAASKVRRPQGKKNNTLRKKPAPAGKVAAASGAKKQAVQPSAKPTETEKLIEKENALLPPGETAAPDPDDGPQEEPSDEDLAADAELEAAARILRQAKQKQENSGRLIPPPAAKNTTATVPSNKARHFNPNVYRPGVEWKLSESKNFTIYTQKRDFGSGTANMSNVFEQAYNTLKRFIPWMMSDRVRVFVYQDYQSYLKYEPNAKPWSRALAYPTRGEIVVYDEPQKTQELKEMFTHELVHIFTQKFFDKRHTHQIMTPAWLDEGLAVLMEDQAYNGTQGGPWAQDFKNLNLQRDKSSRMSLGWDSPRPARRKPGRTVTFLPFDQFMREGSLNMMESNGQTQDWYFQAYTMVRFLLNPGNSSYPSKRMQFEQFTRLLSQGEAVRDPSTGFLKKDSKGRQIYEPYSPEKALKRVYYYNDMNAFEDAFWKWANAGGSGYSL
ncbi:DUF2268 domain-containing putative Zn-dependent protease [Candidatus Avelusimicrobium faecicola]|uniref:DUF2268 domain-containing putative Zn-dependent protease n=1 Tax=Candidatus Avelusimicrobium faecicola TaxID=3416205 RepID=UPI003D128E84